MCDSRCDCQYSDSSDEDDDDEGYDDDKDYAEDYEADCFDFCCDKKNYKTYPSQPCLMLKGYDVEFHPLSRQ